MGTPPQQAGWSGRPSSARFGKYPEKVSKIRTKICAFFSTQDVIGPNSWRCQDTAGLIVSEVGGTGTSDPYSCNTCASD